MSSSITWGGGLNPEQFLTIWNLLLPDWEKQEPYDAGIYIVKYPCWLNTGMSVYKNPPSDPGYWYIQINKHTVFAADSVVGSYYAPGDNTVPVKPGDEISGNNGFSLYPCLGYPVNSPLAEKSTKTVMVTKEITQLKEGIKKYQSEKQNDVTY